MHRIRFWLSWLILIGAVIAMIVPLQDENTDHLLSAEETSDDTLVIMTTDKSGILDLMVERYVAQHKQDVQVKFINPDQLTAENLQDAQADLLLVAELNQLEPLVTENTLDTITRDILWNIDPRFRDSAGRWMAFAGHYRSDEQMQISALAIAQSSDSKDLVQHFLSAIYIRASQQWMVEQTGQYSLVEFGVQPPASLPRLSALNLPSLAETFDISEAKPENRELASKD